MIYKTYDEWLYHRKKSGGCASKQEIWDAASENAINALLKKVKPRDEFKSLEAEGISINFDNAERDAKQIGLEYLREVMYYTGVQPSVVGNWHESMPYLFIAVCVGVYEMKKQTERYGKIAETIRERVKIENERKSNND